MSKVLEIARTILAGFDRHYRLFREISAGARERFERADWQEAARANRERIAMYDARVREAVEQILRSFPGADVDETLWPEIKLAYIGLLYEHRRPELAETFFNSVVCRVLHRTYYHNKYLFWRPAISTDFIEGDEPTYRSYYPERRGLRRALLGCICDYRFSNRFRDLRGDIRCLMRAVEEHFPGQRRRPNFQVQVLHSLFYRNKAAYIIGRVFNGNDLIPFAVPMLQDESGRLYLDAVLLETPLVMTLFSFARAYFMVDMDVPSAYVGFLRTILPDKPLFEIYNMLGLQKQGKTMLYRELHQHLRYSTDDFVIAPGIRGMVMLVFTLPSFPYVFKVIRDHFEPPKEGNRQTVKNKYQLVKLHDRVGRLADTLEYSQVGFPLHRVSAELLAELRRHAPSCIEIDGDQLIVNHVYIERRMIPLNEFLGNADVGEDAHRRAIDEYGKAIRELAGANIFPGDMMLKNFGVTRNYRVVFYDYDEICYMTDCNFRRTPPPRSFEDELMAEPAYSVGPGDVFPEQFAQFFFSDESTRRQFYEKHAELVEPRFWRNKKAQIEAGHLDDILPYPERLRFSRRFA